MRRMPALTVVGATAVAVVVFVLAACTPGPAGRPAALMFPSLGASMAATSPGDPILTKQVCAAAALLTGDSANLYTDKLTALEQAAAAGDKTTMVAAAEAIQDRFVQLAAGLGALSHRSVSPKVKAVLIEASAAISEIASQTYAGTTTDIKNKLTDLGNSFARVCL
jgi:hypothetical protein